MKFGKSVTLYAVRYKLLFFIAFLAIAGCSYYSPNRAKLESKAYERARENNSAALIASEHANKKIAETKANIENTNFYAARLSIEGANAANSITTEFLRRNQNLIGLPVEPQINTVQNLLSTNPIIRMYEEKRQDYKENQEESLRKKIRELEDKLLEYGSAYEAERNKNIGKKTWGWLVGSFGTLGAIAFIVFCPAIALPLFGHLLSWVIGIMPKLAGLVGLVGKNAFEGVAKGISSVRTDLKKTKEISPEKTYTAAEVLKMLDTELLKATDAQHRNIIDSIRKSKNL